MPTKKVLLKALELAGQEMWNGRCPWEAGELDDDETCPIKGWCCDCDKPGGEHEEDCGYCSRTGNFDLEAECWAQLQVQRAEKMLKEEPPCPT